MQIPTALCGILNFVHVHDPGEAALSEVADFFIDDSGSGFNPAGSAEEVESEVSMKCNQIAEAMWDDYQNGGLYTPPPNLSGLHSDFAWTLRQS